MGLRLTLLRQLKDQLLTLLGTLHENDRDRFLLLLHEVVLRSRRTGVTVLMSVGSQEKCHQVCSPL